MIYATSVPTYSEFWSAYPGLFDDDDVSVQYLIDEEVLKVPHICHVAECNGLMSKVKIGRYMYQCCRCRASKSMLDGTFFSGSHLGVAKILHFVYLLIARATAETLVNTLGMDHKTVTKWRGFVQELMMLDLEGLPEEEMKLGGPDWILGVDSIVEIDECKLGKRKFHMGHRVEGVWVVGLIERSRPGYVGKFVVVSVPDRSAPTLEAIIEKYVQPGSCMHSDMWKGYRTMVLNELGILHRTVNHSLFFKDPVTGTHTNTIEGIWQAVKYRVPRQSRTAARVDPHLWEFMWRRRHNSVRWARIILCLRLTRYDGNEAILVHEVGQDEEGFPVEDVPVQLPAAVPVVVAEQEEDEVEEYMWGEPLGWW